VQSSPLAASTWDCIRKMALVRLAPRVRQVPQQLMQAAHDREHSEHQRRAWLAARGGAPPVLAAEGDLRDLLPGAEAVIDGTAAEAALP
jgi:hypothetical protein